MKIITGYPVIVDKKRVNPRDFYLNAAGDTTSTQAGTSKWDKLKSFATKAENIAQDSGATDLIKNKLGANTDSVSSVQTTPTPPASAPEDDKKKKGMSTTIKVLIGVGSAVLIGGIIFYIVKKNKKK